MAANKSSRTRLQPGDRKRILLNRGCEIFARHSFHEISLDEIAQHCSISKALMVHYFGTKEEFYLATLEQACAALIRLTERSEALSGNERLYAIFQDYLDWAEKHSGLYRALVNPDIGRHPSVERLLARRREHYRSVVSLSLFGDIHVSHNRIYAFIGATSFVESITASWLVRRDVSKARIKEMLVKGVQQILY